VIRLFGRKRSRHIPMKSQRLAQAKKWQEFYSDPSNEGKPFRERDYEFDHIEPFCEGGSHEPHNIRWITRKENRRKGAKRIN
jgi:hypothetical protein